MDLLSRWGRSGGGIESQQDRRRGGEGGAGGRRGMLLRTRQVWLDGRWRTEGGKGRSYRVRVADVVGALDVEGYWAELSLFGVVVRCASERVRGLEELCEGLRG